MVARRKKPAHRSMGGDDDGEVRVGEIYLSDAVPDTELFFISQLSCAMKTAGLPIYISKRTPPRAKRPTKLQNNSENLPQLQYRRSLSDL